MMEVKEVVKRLRRGGAGTHLEYEAADLIERQQQEIAELVEGGRKMVEAWKRQQQEIERLRALLPHDDQQRVAKGQPAKNGAKQ